MRERISAHRSARPPGWQTLERPLRVGAALAGCAAGVVVLDCITLLVSNVLMAAGESAPAGQVEAQVRTEID